MAHVARVALVAHAAHTALVALVALVAHVAYIALVALVALVAHVAYIALVALVAMADSLVSVRQRLFIVEKLNLEKLTVRLGLTVIYFPIFRQARPDFFRVCLQLRKDVSI